MEDEITNTDRFILKEQFKYCKIELVADQPHIAIITATEQYIPIDEFKKAFNHIGQLVQSDHITKLVFDKRKLTVFHQPSMEWYFSVWKDEMYELGLRIHRKILPNDNIFKQSVSIGRKTIEERYPEGKFRLMDIQYASSIEEAINQ